MATVLICRAAREWSSTKGGLGGWCGRCWMTAGTWLESGAFAGDGLNDAELALVNERVTTVCRGGSRGGLREVA